MSFLLSYKNWHYFSLRLGWLAAHGIIIMHEIDFTSKNNWENLLRVPNWELKWNTRVLLAWKIFSFDLRNVPMSHGFPRRRCGREISLPINYLKSNIPHPDKRYLVRLSWWERYNVYGKKTYHSKKMCFYTTKFQTWTKNFTDNCDKFPQKESHILVLERKIRTWWTVWNKFSK